MLSLEDLRNQSFPVKTKLEWEAKAEESVKGKKIESLQSATYENIVLKLLYTRQDEQPLPEYPGGSDFRRGIYPLGYLTNQWKIAQRISYQTFEELKVKLYQSIEKGQTALSFEVSRELFATNESLSNLLTDLVGKHPFAINSKGMQPAILASLVKAVEQEENSEKVTGYIGHDPISIFAVEGFISERLLDDWSEDIVLANESFPYLRTVLIDTTPYHNGGANAVQELGIAVAEGVYYLQKQIEKGMSIETVLSKFVFQFSIGGNFFMEIAKLRAARILWNKITEVYGAEDSSYGMQISAQTSSFTKSIFDPHVNLLRAGNEAFAAVVGGVQYLHVNPFDEITGSNPFSERIARNMQLLLKEEAHLQKVIDPAGGSWYVEELTAELAEKAWGFFQEIEANGGILEGLKTNWLQAEIAEVFAKRNKDVLIRKQSIVGTNVYANLDETVATQNSQKAEQYFVTTPLKELITGIENVLDDRILKASDLQSRYEIKAVPERRLSEPFDEMRKKAKLLEGKIGSKPTVGMICLGELKQYKARLDFMKGFLAAGGIGAEESKPIGTLENARQFVGDLHSNYLCFCSSNDQYETMGHEILSSLKDEFPDRIFYLAGLPEKEKHALWINEGINQFIHVKSNCYEIASTILNELEVSANEEAKA